MRANKNQPTFEEMLERVLAGEMTESAIVHHYYYVDEYAEPQPVAVSPGSMRKFVVLGRGRRKRKD
jgi:hypothetical protein